MTGTKREPNIEPPDRLAVHVQCTCSLRSVKAGT